MFKKTFLTILALTSTIALSGPLKNLVEKAVTNTDMITTTTTDPISLHGASSIAVQAVIDDNTDAAKNFLAGEAEINTLNFDDRANMTAGEYLVIADGNGLLWAVAADLDGDDDPPSGVIWSSIPAGRKAQADLSSAPNDEDIAAVFESAFNALTGFTAVVTLNDGAGDGTMTVTHVIRGPMPDATPLLEDDGGAGSIGVTETNEGVASTVNVGDDEITIVGHGLPTGMKGQASSDATLPTGLSTSTDYFVIAVDANTIQLAASLANALAGTAINLTNQGTDGATHTFTPTSIAGATIALQKSNDKVTWTDTATPTNITVDATVWFEDDAPGYRWARLRYTITAGSMTAVNNILVKGE